MRRQCWSRSPNRRTTRWGRWLWSRARVRTGTWLARRWVSWLVIGQRREAGLVWAGRRARGRFNRLAHPARRVVYVYVDREARGRPRCEHAAATAKNSSTYHGSATQAQGRNSRGAICGCSLRLIAWSDMRLSPIFTARPALARCG